MKETHCFLPLCLDQLTCLDVFIMSGDPHCVKLLAVVEVGGHFLLELALETDVFMLDVGEVVDDDLVIMHDIS